MSVCFQKNGKIFLRQTIRRLKPEELIVTNISELNKRILFDSETRDRIEDSISLPENEGKYSMEPDDFGKDSDDEDASENIIPDTDAIDSVGNRINQPQENRQDNCNNQQPCLQEHPQVWDKDSHNHQGNTGSRQGERKQLLAEGLRKVNVSSRSCTQHVDYTV